MKFNFKSNSLSKAVCLRSLLQMITFQSRKNKKKFKEKLGAFFGVSSNHVFLFGAGRMAVYSVLKSLKLKPEDEVIVAGYTCVVLTNAIKFANCKIKYVDIRRESLNIDNELLFSSINENTRVAIIPHNFGLVAESIQKIKEKFPSIIIIEDAAHTFGSRDRNGQLCGTLGDASFFSLEYSKPITTGLGGVLIVNNSELSEAIENEYNGLKKMPFSSTFKIISTLCTMTFYYSKRTQFFYTNGFRFLRLFKLVYQTSKDEINGILPENYPVKLNPLLANFGCNQMNKIEEINGKKNTIQESLVKAFENFKDVEKYETPNTVLARFPILFKTNIRQEAITAIKRDALDKGFLFGEWFNDVVHPKGSFRYGYDAGMCPEGEFVASRILNIPVNAYSGITSSEIQEIVAIFKANGIK